MVCPEPSSKSSKDLLINCKYLNFQTTLNPTSKICSRILNNCLFLQKVSHPILFQEGDVNQTSIHWTVFFAGNSAIVKQKLRKHAIFVRVPFRILRHGIISEGVLPICPLLRNMFEIIDAQIFTLG